MKKPNIKKIFMTILLLCISCKHKTETVQIKLLLLNPENYMNQKILLDGKIKEIGPLNLWFILEDDTGYIQVTTQKISKEIKCLQIGKHVQLNGQMDSYGPHKYFTLEKNIKCEN